MGREERCTTTNRLKINKLALYLSSYTLKVFEKRNHMQIKCN